MFATFPSDWFPSTVWPPDSPLRMLGAIIIVIAACAALLATLLFVVYLLNNAWRKKYAVLGVVTAKSSMYKPDESFPVPDDVHTSEGRMYYSLTVHADDGWSDIAWVCVETYERLHVNARVKIIYKTGRLDGARTVLNALPT